jgi:hypothetical protein
MVRRTLTIGTVLSSGALGLVAAIAVSATPGGAARGGPGGDEALKVEPAVRAQMILCTDGKSHYVAIAPHEPVARSLYYGDGKKMVQVRMPHGGLAGGWFLDPRFYNKTLNDNFRGIDLRLYSAVEFDAEKKTCEVRCGERTRALQIMPQDKAQALLGAATFLPNPRQHEPYALARDDRGTYYFVDHGATPQTEKSFRLFVGPRGDMKKQAMTNVVSDSEGDIFATKTGSLRLILGQKESSWVEGEKPRKLTLLPLEKNLQVVYNDLGVYSGERLGTPCDDL